ncbi:hypothetical protein [Acinetobacter venetianus]|uniref:hypothetical protein n=1 Tax=Acinetobacter venetianus TaxID=52133 RepID=UPI00241D2426|nr:hypothetical protein [Acinetobacter venetianus]
MKKILLTLVITLLAGCTASVVNQSKKLIGHKLYQDSIDSLVSSIRIEQGQNFSVRLYPNGCITSVQPKFLMSPEVESIGVLGGEVRYKPKLLNMPYPPKNIQFAEFKIPAERFVALSAYKSYHTGTELRGCSVDAVYKFSANKNYELLDHKGGNQCSLEVQEILSTGERVELKPLKYLRNINEWAGCEAQLEGL